MQKMIALKNLRFGEEHKPPLNVRKTGRDVAIEELAASIDSHGMGQALNVVEDKSLAYVEDPREPGFGFCGAPPLEGKRYCPMHHERSLPKAKVLGA